MELENLE